MFDFAFFSQIHFFLHAIRYAIPFGCAFVLAFFEARQIKP